MKSLIFLDLYDNRIEKICGIATLVNLRVLMLGKNRIQKIENLNELIFLDILDLHGNQVILIRSKLLRHKYMIENKKNLIQKILKKQFLSGTV